MSKRKTKKLILTQDKIELGEPEKVEKEVVKPIPTIRHNKNLNVKSIVYKGK